MNTEASRCLLCKKPKCALDGCPVHTPIPECMLLYRQGNLEEAGRLLFQNNPLTAVTSLVCDWKKFCNGHCVLNVKQVPVRWYEIEQEISGRYLETCTLQRQSEEFSGKRVAIVGAGIVGGTKNENHIRTAEVVHAAQERIGTVIMHIVKITDQRA